MFETPILLIVFNRPNTTRRVFEVIRQQKPKFLFVAADGPRLDHPDDVGKCSAARNEIKVDWDCELKTLYRTENRGCGRGPSEAITWFFENVDRGIILEDDCLLTSDGFQFYEKMLQHFNDNSNVGVITATNTLLKWRHRKMYYIVSGPGSPTMGCWASWKRAWNYFDYDMSVLDNPQVIERIKRNFRFSQEFSFWIDKFRNRKGSDSEDIWDYQWQFARALYAPVTIVSSVNMVSNIGFHDEATHTKITTNHAELPVFKGFPSLDHPGFKHDFLYEWLVFQKYFNSKPRSIYKRSLMKMVRYLYT
jgi:GR25 family glycosyltransferase involved in LPS biosynthesis